MNNLAFIFTFTFILTGLPNHSQAKSRLVTYYTLSEAFKHPNEVRCLILENEHDLTSLPTEIEKLKNLVILKIKGSSISEVPQELAQFKYLHNLEISSSKLKEIPHPITLCKNLKYLNLRNNQIKLVPTEVSRLVQLVYLDLGGNQISSLPNEIAELKQLQQLIMDHNKLNTIPSEIGDLSSLHNLILSDNLIHCLPPEIGKLKRLSQLGLHRNNLVSLPSEIGNMRNLKNLLLNSNKLKELPIEIRALKQLRSLRAAFNAIEEFPSHILEIEGLYDLNFRGNAFCLSEQEEKKVKHIVPVTIHGIVRPSGIRNSEPINLTIAVFNGLNSSIHHINEGAVDIHIADIYRNGNPLELNSSQLNIEAPNHMVQGGTVEVESGAVMYLHTDARGWKLREGWQPGKYEIKFRIENLKADEFCMLSVLSRPVCFEIK